MRALIFSDTHGDINPCIKVIQAIGEVDHIIHLGDIVRDALDLAALFDIPVTYIAGNNDYSSPKPQETIMELGGFKILLTHGHQYTSFDRPERIAKVAKQKGCSAALFGHSHKGIYQVIDEIMVLNPGSLTRPRDFKPSYGVLEVEGSKLAGAVCNTTI